MQKSRVFVVLLVLALSSGLIELSASVAEASSSSSSNDWPMFQHDPSHSGYSDSKPVRTAPEVLWTFKTESPISVSVAVGGGYVYAIDQGRMYALNASTGQKVWDKHGARDYTPAVENGVVYTCINGGTAYNATTGEIIWSTNSTGTAYSPTTADGVVYLSGTDSRSLNASTGALIWNYTGLSTSPAISGDKLFVENIALDKFTGELLWSASVNDWVQSSPAVYGGYVYFGSYDNNLYCVDAASGVRIWNYSTGGLVLSSPAISNGRVFVGSFDGNIYAFNATTGAKIWSYQTGTPIESSPAIAQDVVYIGSDNGNLYAFNVVSGTELWSYPVQGP